MPIDVRIPTLGESVSEGVIARWIKADGDAVRTDEPLLELETDKASVEIPAEAAGVLKILKAEGETVQVGDVVARIEDGARAATPGVEAAAAATPAADAEPEAASRETAGGIETQRSTLNTEAPFPRGALSPAVRRLVEEHELDPQAITATGRGGRLTKADVLAHIEHTTAAPPATSPQPSAVSGQPAAPTPSTQPSTLSPQPSPATAADEERVPMSHLRQRIADRLVQAQHTAAILTTFNEVDLTAVMELRARHKERFTQVHGVSLGFMSFFARACISAMRDLPIVNAQIRGTEIVYKKHVHLGVAVSTERGLVVPVVHGADRLSFAEIEQEIERLAGLARQNKLGIDDLSGGTFTISNGGVFGSLLSTPILTPPQSAILGMHKIQKRPVVIDDQIVIRPMMYLALSYDHRLVDGEHAVTFLVRVKERLEDPSRMLFDI